MTKKRRIYKRTYTRTKAWSNVCAYMQSVSQSAIVIVVAVLKLNMTHHRCERFTTIKSKIITQLYIWSRLVHTIRWCQDDKATEHPTKSHRNLNIILPFIVCIQFLSLLNNNNNKKIYWKIIQMRVFKFEHFIKLLPKFFFYTLASVVASLTQLVKCGCKCQIILCFVSGSVHSFAIYIECCRWFFFSLHFDMEAS